MEKKPPYGGFSFFGGGAMKLGDCIQAIEKLFPLSWAEDWDNPGLLSGDPMSNIERISVSLDATVQTVTRAAESGSNLLVTHHPAFIHPLKRLTPDFHEGATLFEAIRRGVALYSIHTNWDVSPEGVNRVLAEKAGLADPLPLSQGFRGAWGLGAYGELAVHSTLSQLAAHIMKAWDLSWIRVLGEPTKPVGRIALCGGAGGDTLQDAVRQGVDAFITADLRYHQILAGRFSGLSLLVCDHGEMESASLDRLTELIISSTGLPAKRLTKNPPSGYFDLRETGKLAKE
jgi:dinuclear metal center YbgI/SA1388 family protein